MARPTIEEIKERRRRVEEALAASSLGAFKACLQEVETPDLEAVRKGVAREYKYNPESRTRRLLDQAIDIELERREESKK